MAASEGLVQNVMTVNIKGSRQKHAHNSVSMFLERPVMCMDLMVLKIESWIMDSEIKSPSQSWFTIWWFCAYI